ncbi:ABC transporter permease [Aeromicrobium choanae]|uniref:Peptide/nickel transport system permease protein n=1 Tax=Aeromicrobium choanae TaxID=1736691 RepID=A0A1T4Z3B6_9ACTN|nr:ABC transporter permease [Aeromicrobium choanae]SKB08446.1 peptide/nickel transport system permease protein [Aeromicrobium choanae]
MKFHLLKSAVLRLAVVVLLLIFGVFFLIRLVPGDPATIIAGLSASTSTVDSIREDFQLDRSLGNQLLHYLTGLPRGDLGISFGSRQPVVKVIFENAGPTLQLAVVSLLFIGVAGIGAGLAFGALSRTRFAASAEIVFSVVAGACNAIPHFLLATVLAFVFAVTLQVFPVAGDSSLAALVLPAIAISVGPAALIARLCRVRVLDVLESSYVTAARSKRLGSAQLYATHVLPNALVSAVSMLGVVFASLIGGAVVVEQVFSRRGLGSALVEAVLLHDYPIVQGITLVVGIAVVLVNFGVDVLLAFIDPRRGAVQ